MRGDIKVGVVGGTGYTGLELLSILLRHPHASIELVSSRKQSGQKISDYFPSLVGADHLSFSAPDQQQLAACDVIFFATPHGVCMENAPFLLSNGVRVIDLSADFRIKDALLFEQWYGMPHSCPELLQEAVYGLTEYTRQAVQSARIIANPGCYPTATQLALIPLLQAGLIETDPIIVDAKSGVSGAGREAKVTSLFSEIAESFKAYALDGHRHHPEIVQQLNLAAQSNVSLTFTPHLIPINRGIEASIYALPKEGVTAQTCFDALRSAYEDAYFVQVQTSIPDTRSVRGSNHCHMSVHRPKDSPMLVVSSVIDNLVKGAAGQAVQNMNVLFGLAETTALQASPLAP